MHCKQMKNLDKECADSGAERIAGAYALKRVVHLSDARRSDAHPWVVLGRTASEIAAMT
jgi:hypothetical protein